jgi:hypothetical protein
MVEKWVDEQKVSNNVWPPVTINWMLDVIGGIIILCIIGHHWSPADKKGMAA